MYMNISINLSLPKFPHLSIPKMPSRHTGIPIYLSDAASATLKVEQYNVARDEALLQYDGATTQSDGDVDTASPYMDEFMKDGGSTGIIKMCKLSVEEFESIFTSIKDDVELQWMSRRGKKSFFSTKI